MLDLQPTRFSKLVKIYCNRSKFDPLIVKAPEEGQVTCEVESDLYERIEIIQDKDLMVIKLKDLTNGNALTIIYEQR